MFLTKTPRRLAVEAICALGIALLVIGNVAAHAAGPGDYIVIDGKVDQDIYDGYITYTRSCMACHGPDGLGSSFAPSLIKVAERRNFGEFANTVATGLQIRPGHVMPSFSDDKNVLSNVANIYSYMKARGAGDLGRGRPKVIEETQTEKVQTVEAQPVDEGQG